MLYERMDIGRFTSDMETKPEQGNDELREAEEMHNRSLSILADHLRITTPEAEQRLQSYMADGSGIDKSDQRLARIVATAKKTYSTLQTRKANSKN